MADIRRPSAPAAPLALSSTAVSAMPKDHCPPNSPSTDTVEVDARSSHWPPPTSNNDADDENDDALLPDHYPGIQSRDRSEDQAQLEENDQDLSDEEPDQHSDSASMVSSNPYDEDDEELESTLNAEALPSLRHHPTSSKAAVSITPIAPKIAKRQSREVFESVVVPRPSQTAETRSRRASHWDALATATGAFIASMTKSRSQSQPQIRGSPHTPMKALDVAFLPPTTFSPASSQAPIRHNEIVQQIPSDDIQRIKSESSPSPSSSTADLEAQLKTLDTQRRITTSRLDAHNNSLETLSPRLNTLFSTCSALAQTRKSLLQKRKLLAHGINANREELKETKTKAGRLQVRQAEVIEARDKAQYHLDVLMEQRRGIRNALGRKRYDEALIASFPDRGAREIARRVGWKPTPVPADGSEEHPLDLVDSDDDGTEDTNEESAPWLRVANAFMEGDTSLDFEDLSGLQEGLEDVDKRVKQEQDQGQDQHQRIGVKEETTSQRDFEDVTEAIKAESSNGASSTPPTNSMPSSSQTLQPEETFEGYGTEDGTEPDLSAGEITLEKLQAHFKAMEQHKKEAAKMLRTLAGVQKGMKRKEALEGAGRAEKVRRSGG